MKVIFPTPALSYREQIKKDVKEVAQEFEGILLGMLMKEAFKPLTKGKSFPLRMNYEMFAENVGRALAKSGGIGIARFIIDNYYGRGGHNPEQKDREGDPEVRREIPYTNIY